MNEDDIGLFQSQDGGPSKVNFEVIDPTKVVYSIPRRLPYAQRPWLQAKLDEWCKSGIIEEVSSKNTGKIIHTSPIIEERKKIISGNFSHATESSSTTQLTAQIAKNHFWLNNVNNVNNFIQCKDINPY